MTAGAWALAGADGHSPAGAGVGADAGGGSGRTDEVQADGRPRRGVWELPRSPAAVGRARRELGAMLERLGVGQDAADAVLLVTHELLVNGVEHGRTAVRLTAALTARSVRVDVHDGSSRPPQLQPMDPAAARGRGLQMVEALAGRWGWRLDGDGKTVWAEVPVVQGHLGPAS